MSHIEQYHDLTSYNRMTLGGHGLDWSNQPDPFKSYDGVMVKEMPATRELPNIKLSAAIGSEPTQKPARDLDVSGLASILVLTHAITARARHAGGEFFYRSVASAGALYPFELYLATTGVEGLDDGLYHHGVAQQNLSKLRDGSYQNEVIRLVQTRLEYEPTLTFFLSSIFFRSSWKYRDRAYRYHLLDTGHMLENLSISLKALQIPFLVCHDFLDSGVNFLLGLTPEKEACLAMVCAWPRTTGSIGYMQSLDDITMMVGEASTVAPVEADYPAILRIHDSSSDHFCKDKSTVAAIDHLGLNPGRWDQIPDHGESVETWDLPDTIQNRRSMRNFSNETLPKAKMGFLLDALCSDKSVRAHPKTSRSDSIATGFLSSHIEGFDNGFHLLDANKRATSVIQKGDLIETMTRICLGQDWLARCAAHFLFMTNLEILEHNWGPRGYRYAMLSAGSLGQRLYLAATSMKIGCCGVGAFFDDEASQLLGLNDKSRLLYVVAIGPVKKWAQR